jgi:signal recognition particle subunit SRP54
MGHHDAQPILSPRSHQAEIKMKKYEAIIQSMTKGERANPQLLITDKSARSRTQRIAKGSGNKLEVASAFLAEFQQMRTMMSRMSKMAGGDPNDMKAAMAGMGGGGGSGGAGGDKVLPPAGNRAARRADKKGSSKRTGGPGGFGKK